MQSHTVQVMKTLQPAKKNVSDQNFLFITSMFMMISFSDNPKLTIGLGVCGDRRHRTLAIAVNRSENLTGL
jgi:hypothetical protein